MATYRIKCWNSRLNLLLSVGLCSLTSFSHNMPVYCHESMKTTRAFIYSFVSELYGGRCCTQQEQNAIFVLNMNCADAHRSYGLPYPRYRSCINTGQSSVIYPSVPSHAPDHSVISSNDLNTCQPEQTSSLARYTRLRTPCSS